MPPDPQREQIPHVPVRPGLFQQLSDALLRGAVVNNTIPPSLQALQCWYPAMRNALFTKIFTQLLGPLPPLLDLRVATIHEECERGALCYIFLPNSAL